MGKENAACPICKRSEGVTETRIRASMASYHCPVCSEYEIPPFVPEVHGASAPNHKLSAWVREHNERGEPVRFARAGVLADVTEQRSGVYFEAGYALGLGLPVIWSVRKDDAKNVHFDTAQYSQIRWESAKNLEEGLLDYICAIIGQRSRSQT